MQPARKSAGASPQPAGREAELPMAARSSSLPAQARLFPLPHPGLLAAAVLVLAAAPRLANLGVYSGSFDEGVRAEQLLLMAAGYRPFRDIFASQGVLLLDLLYPWFR